MTVQQIEAKIESYAVFHLATLVADVQAMNTAFTAGNFEQVGADAGKVAQAVF